MIYTGKNVNERKHRISNHNRDRCGNALSNGIPTYVKARYGKGNGRYRILDKGIR